MAPLTHRSAHLRFGTWSIPLLLFALVASSTPATLAAAETLPLVPDSTRVPQTDVGTDGIALGYYRPSFPNDLSSLPELEQSTGQPAAIIHWYALWGGWKSQFNTADLTAVSGHGSIPMITWEPWAGTSHDPAWSLSTAILSGAHDAYIHSWARGLAAYGQPVLLRFAQEMNNQPGYPWAVGVNGNTAEDYVATWKHVRAIFAQYDTSNVRWIWNPNVIGKGSVAQYTSMYQSLYPGDDLVDWVGLDIYNTGSGLDWGAPDWRTFGQILSAPYAALGSIAGAKPIILSEVGSTELGGSKAHWITSALDAELTSFPRVRALNWFDVSKEQSWQLHSSPAALNAWRVATAAPQFAVRGAWWRS